MSSLPVNNNVYPSKSLMLGALAAGCLLFAGASHAQAPPIWDDGPMAAPAVLLGAGLGVGVLLGLLIAGSRNNNR